MITYMAYWKSFSALPCIWYEVSANKASSVVIKASGFPDFNALESWDVGRQVIYVTCFVYINITTVPQILKILQTYRIQHNYWYLSTATKILQKRLLFWKSLIPPQQSSLIQNHAQNRNIFQNTFLKKENSLVHLKIQGYNRWDSTYKWSMSIHILSLCKG